MELWSFGGELNTIPTATPEEQCSILQGIIDYYKDVKTNHRSNLHVHVRVPTLIDNLPALKQLATYNFENKDILKLIEPIPTPVRLEFNSDKEYQGAYKRYKRCLVSHHTVLSKKKVDAQLKATSITEFFEAEVPRSSKRPLWHLSPRAAVNVRQLLETDTIEFRHFPGTLNLDELLTAIEWCRDYLNAALNTQEPAILLYRRQYKDRTFPTFPPFNYKLDQIFKLTKHGGILSKEQINNNIKKILKGELP